MKKKTFLATLGLILAITNLTVSAQDLSAWATVSLTDIKKVKAGLDSSNSNEGFRLSQSTNDDWIKYSVSKIARDKFFNSSKFNYFEKAEVSKALDSLAISAARELENYKPNSSNFAFKNPVHEKLIKNRLANLATLKIHKIGFATTNWLIHTNNYGLPRLRFKRGYIYARDSKDDHNFCHIYYISVNQDYSGGGTFGAAYPSFVSDELAACPK
ncbi:MAG: hypothetical protein AAB336_05500 [Acidobacteriota bacterium]